MRLEWSKKPGTGTYVATSPRGDRGLVKVHPLEGCDPWKWGAVILDPNGDCGPDEELRFGRAATKEEAMLAAEVELLDYPTWDACGPLTSDD
jgi:hypothetical protein